MLNRTLADHDRDSRQTSTEIIDPIVLAKTLAGIGLPFWAAASSSESAVTSITYSTHLRSQQHSLQVRRPTANENNRDALSLPSIRAHIIRPIAFTTIRLTANTTEIASQVRLPVTIFCIGAMNALRCSSIGPASASVAAAMTRD